MSQIMMSTVRKIEQKSAKHGNASSLRPIDKIA